MMTAGYPEQGSAGPPSAGGAAVGGASGATSPQPGPLSHTPAHVAVPQPSHEQCLAGQQPLPPDNHAGYHDHAQFEADKRSVYK